MGLWEKQEEEFKTKIVPILQAYKDSHPLETVEWKCNSVLQEITTDSFEVRIDSIRMMLKNHYYDPQKNFHYQDPIDVTISKSDFYFKINKGNLNDYWDRFVKNIELLAKIGLMTNFERFLKYYEVMIKSNRILQMYNELASWKFNITVNLRKWEKDQCQKE